MLSYTLTWRQDLKDKERSLDTSVVISGIAHVFRRSEFRVSTLLAKKIPWLFPICWPWHKIPSVWNKKIPLCSSSSFLSASTAVHSITLYSIYEIHYKQKILNFSLCKIFLLGLSNENGEFYTYGIYPYLNRLVCLLMDSPTWWRFSFCSSGSSLVCSMMTWRTARGRISNMRSSM